VFVRHLVFGLILVHFSGVQADELACPEKTSLSGKKPPEGFEQFCVLTDGIKHGPYKHWYSNGQLMEWLHYKNGKEHGEQTAWWPNGQMMMRGESVNGKRYRSFEYWDVAGNPRELEVKVITEEK
jgi:hypothetical protein